MAIKVTQDIVNKAVTKGLKINDVMATAYEGEIADKVKSNEKLKDFTPLQLAMMDAGVTSKSAVKDFFTNGNELLFPAIVDTRIAELTAKNPILNYIAPNVQNVEGTSIKGMKLDWTSETNKKALDKRDISEGANLPVVSITTGESAINLYKRGVAVRTSYEALMFSKFEMFMRTLNAIAANSANQQTGDAINVLVKGDGNNNAPVVKSAAGATLAASDIVSFAVDFAMANNGLAMDTIVCNPVLAKQLLAMTVDTNFANGYKAGATFNFPQFDLKNITVVADERVPQNGGKDIIIGLNRENALTKYVTIGSQINEIASNIQNQTKLGTLSEIAGFGKFIDTASMIMKLA